MLQFYKTNERKDRNLNDQASISILFNKNDIMITYFIEKLNTLNQELYDDSIKDIQLHTLTCSCHHSGCFIKHGYYTRKIKTKEGVVHLRILRLYCKECGKTHALLLSTIVPYSQILLHDHLSIIKESEQKALASFMEENLLIDESNIAYIKNQFNKYWKQKLISFSIKLDEQLTSLCFRFFHRQFMQIKCTTNLLYIPTHIT